MVAHGILHILYGNFTVGFHKQRHRGIGVTQYIRQKFVATVGKHIKVTPYTGLTVTACAKIKGRICIGKTEVLVYSFKIPLFAGKRDNIRRIHTVLLIVHIELMNTTLVGMCGNTVIGHTDSHPYGTAYTGSLANHLHDPDLIRIGNRK